MPAVLQAPDGIQDCKAGTVLWSYRAAYHKINDPGRDCKAKNACSNELEGVLADNGIPCKPQEEDGGDQHDKADVQQLSCCRLLQSTQLSAIAA